MEKSKEKIYKLNNSKLGGIKRCSMNVVNFTLNSKVLNIKTKERPDFVTLLRYYLNKV